MHRTRPGCYTPLPVEKIHRFPRCKITRASVKILQSHTVRKSRRPTPRTVGFYEGKAHRSHAPTPLQKGHHLLTNPRGLHIRSKPEQHFVRKHDLTKFFVWHDGISRSLSLLLPNPRSPLLVVTSHSARHGYIATIHEVIFSLEATPDANQLHYPA